MINIKLLAVVTTLSIYHGCSTWKTFWEKKFTLGELSAENVKFFGRNNVRKQIYIKVSDMYITLVISLKFDSPEKMKITSSESKNNSGRSVKGLITSMGIKAKVGSHKYKKARYAIGNVSKEDL